MAATSRDWRRSQRVFFRNGSPSMEYSVYCSCSLCLNRERDPERGWFIVRMCRREEIFSYSLRFLSLDAYVYIRGARLVVHPSMVTVIMPLRQCHSSRPLRQFRTVHGMQEGSLFLFFPLSLSSLKRWKEGIRCFRGEPESQQIGLLSFTSPTNSKRPTFMILSLENTHTHTSVRADHFSALYIVENENRTRSGDTLHVCRTEELFTTLIYSLFTTSFYFYIHVLFCLRIRELSWCKLFRTKEGLSRGQVWYSLESPYRYIYAIYATLLFLFPSLFCFLSLAPSARFFLFFTLTLDQNFVQILHLREQSGSLNESCKKDRGRRKKIKLCSALESSSLFAWSYLVLGRTTYRSRLKPDLPQKGDRETIYFRPLFPEISWI